ncbi:MAG: beta-propeller domain-containing protein [Nocardioidaceae bacterium]
MARPDKTRWMVIAGGAAVLSAVAATVPAIAPSTSPVALQQAAADERPLQAFDDCAELTAWYQRQALAQVGPWGLQEEEWRYGGPILDVASDTRAAAPTPAAGIAEAVGNGATGTNVQEAGVDEPDVAKTSGDLVVAVRNERLRVTDVSGTEPIELSSLQLSNYHWDHELLLLDNRAIIFGTRRAMPYYSRDLIAPQPGWGSAMRSPALITVVDLADPANLSIVSREKYSGVVSTAREHEGTVRVVLTTSPSLPFVRPGRGYDTDEARRHNRQVVRAASAQDWLPSRGVDNRDRGGEALLSCGDVTHPEKGAGLGTVAVLTINPAEPLALEATALSADGDMVYASTDRLYVATTQGGWSSWGFAKDTLGRRDQARTEVHAFATEGDETTYVASGSVPGIAPDRWAFSEYDGRLRLVTQLDWSRGRQGHSKLSVLEERDDELVTVGQVDGLGEGEDIRAVRWFGDLAVLVTFRQTDPLYTLDLTDPEAPRVIGELKITGFSEYLHPLGEDLLLGVGQGASDRGRTTGSQASVFDLRDLTQPRLLDRLSLGHSTSSVETDSRAFTYLPEQRLALIPVGGWGRRASIQVVSVGTEGTLTVTETLPVQANVSAVRALPLSDSRVAVIRSGVVDRIFDLG